MVISLRILITFTTLVFYTATRIPLSRSVEVKILSSSIKSDLVNKTTPLGVLDRIKKLPDGYKNAIASGLASIIAKIILQPFDTIKTVQQASNLKLSPISAILKTIQRDGIVSLWSGIGPTILGAAPSSSVYFGIYSTTKTYTTNYFGVQYTAIAIIVCAAFANTFASFFRTPFEVIKQRIQTGAHKSTMEAFLYSWKHDGPWGLFSDGKLASQIARDVPYAIGTSLSYDIFQAFVKTYLVTHSHLQHHIDTTTTSTTATNNTNNNNDKSKQNKSVDNNTTNDKKNVNNKVTSNEVKTNGNTKMVISSPSATTTTSTITPFQQWTISCELAIYRFFMNRRLRDALCGSLAGGFSSLLTTPMDVVKTRLMTDKAYKTVWTAIIGISQNEGIPTFFRGVTPRLMHKIPANGLFFLFYEVFKQMLGVKLTRS